MGRGSPFSLQLTLLTQTNNFTSTHVDTHAYSNMLCVLAFDATPRRTSSSSSLSLRRR